MSDPFNIVRARREDIEQILEIQAECGLSPWTAAGYAAELTVEGAVVMVARDASDKTIGFIAGRLTDGPESADREAEVFNIGTRPESQKKGAGSGLLGTFVEICRNRGISTVWLEVRASNSGAITFYSRHGFERSGMRPDFYSNPPEDAVIMRLPLSKKALVTKL